MSYKFNPFTGNLDIAEGSVFTGSGTVAAAQDGTVAVPGINFANDLNTGIYRPGNDQLAISTGGAGRLFVDASGNITQEASSPDLTVKDTQSHTSSDGPTLQFQGRGPNNSNYNFGFIRGVSSGVNNAGKLELGTNSAGVQGTAITILPDGTSSFTGTVDIGGWKASNNSLEGARIYSSGSVQVNRTSGGGAILVGRLNNTVTSQITGDGGATFTGRVGIGTSAPTAILHTKTTTAAGYIIAENSSNHQWIFGAADATYAQLGGLYGSHSGIAVDLTGNVGIGTSSASTKLSVIAGSANGIELGQDSNQSTDSSRLFFSTSAGSNAIKSSSGNLRFFTGSTAGTSTGTERMRITSVGKVLIGASTSRNNFNNHDHTALLQLEGAGTDPLALSIVQNAEGHPHRSGGKLILARSDGDAVGSNTLVSDNRTVGLISFQGNDGSEFVQLATITAQTDSSTNYNDMPGRLIFATTADGGTAPSERMRISSDGTSTFTGVVQVGGNPDGGAAAGAQLYPTGTLKLGAVGNSGKSIQIYQTDDGSTTPKIEFLSGGSATFAGTINGTTVGTSDVRFKENIAPAQPQLDDVVALGGLLKNFDWNEDAPVNEEIHATRQLGLIAQEVEEVCPFLTKTIARTKQGAELTPEQVVPAVYEERVVPAVLDESGEVITPETTEQVKVADEHTIPATYEELDDSYKAISHDALIMKLLGAVAELSAEVAALKNA